MKSCNEDRPASSWGVGTIKDQVNFLTSANTRTNNTSIESTAILTPRRSPLRRITMMGSASPSSSLTLGGPRPSRSVSSPSQSDYDPSINWDYGKDIRSNTSSGQDKRRSGKPRWLGQVKDWLFVSEPSAQAMKQQRSKIYKRQGIDLKDPQAAAKLHFPLGTIPAGAITSSSGPSPEKALKKGIKEKQLRQNFVRTSPTCQSLSSRESCSQSIKGSVGRDIAPWDG